MQRAGHSDFETTRGYIREAENLREGFGQVLPPRPPGLTAAGFGIAITPRYLASAGNDHADVDSVAATVYYTTPCP